MLAEEARKTASEKIWNSLPSIIRHNIEDAVDEGGLNCKIVFNNDKMGKYDFDNCIRYFQNLNELGYETAMHKELGEYVITILW
jgi:hypothetical protein